MITPDDIMIKIQGMIVAVHLSQHLQEDEKDYICNLLTEAMAREIKELRRSNTLTN